jgi:hypothetical protein
MNAEQRHGEQRDGCAERTSLLLVGLRYVLPAVVVLAGLIVMALGSDIDLEGGASIVSAGLAIYAMNWLYRASVDGDRERDEEDAARGYFDANGHWPDQSRAVRPAGSGWSRPSSRRG